MKRSKKKNRARLAQKAEVVSACNDIAAAMRQSSPELYFAEKVRASENFAAMMNTHVAAEAVRKAFDKGVDAGGKQITDNLGTVFTAAMCLALNEMHGFGRKRICEIMERMNTIMLETFTTRDAVQKVYKKLGLRFSDEDPFCWLTFDD